MWINVGWVDVLTAADVVGLPGGPRQLRLVLPSGAAGAVRLVMVPGALRPAWVRAHRAEWGAERVLITAGSATPAAVEAVLEAGQSVVTDDGWLSVQVEGERVGREPVERSSRALRRGPVPWGALSVVRRLVAAGPLTQVQLAAAAGVRQPQVSKALGAFQDNGLVVRTSQGWQAGDRDRLLDAWLDRYPGPGGLTSRWYALDALPDQLARAVRAHRGRRAVVSGDVAADQLAAWRLPARICLYCTEPADLREHGFVLSGPEEATVVLTSPQDHGVFVPRPAEGAGRAGPAGWAVMDTSAGPVELADPLQILVDVASAPGPDAEEAAAAVRQAVLSETRTSRLRDWLLATSAVSSIPGHEEPG
jgi:hypothetical protein